MGTFFKKWLQKRDGVTAVEFSLVGVPIVFMTVGIIEMALMFASQSLLHESTFAASRVVRTGQVQQAAGGQEDMFRDALCDFAAVMIPCSGLQFQVQQIPDFDAADDEPPTFDADGNLSSTPFDPGVENNVVLIRVVYNYPVMTPLMQYFLANANGGRRTLMSTIVLQTEPYQ